MAFWSPIFAQQLTPTAKINQATPISAKSFHQIQKEMEIIGIQKILKASTVDEDGEDGGAPGWSLYKRWEYYWEQRVNTKTGEFPTNKFSY